MMETPPTMAAPDTGTLGRLVERAARLVGQRVERSRLDDLDRLPEPVHDDAAQAATLFAQAWRLAGLEGEPAPLSSPTPANLPFVARVASRWLLVSGRAADGSWRAEDPAGIPAPLPTLERASFLALPRARRAAAGRPSALGLVRRALWARKKVFADAVLATAIVSLLALATSLYAMQVYDRVIPTQGVQTLWVLTVGVALSVLLEFVLKHLRSHMVDRTCNAIDHELSEWFFARMLGIRMEARPPSVGTLASQVKGFEMVRGVLASTSLFVLADVPFAALFLAVIAMVGGWVVVVPIIAMPIALAVGLAFQGAIQRHTRDTVAASNLKAGLLVEAVDGAEALKANSGEWTVQARWNRLVDQATEADQGIRGLTALSQNLTMALQQLAYVALVAYGAWLVAQNQLTMGALLACTIIGSRAMAPIVQLPGVMGSGPWRAPRWRGWTRSSRCPTRRTKPMPCSRRRAWRAACASNACALPTGRAGRRRWSSSAWRSGRATGSAWWAPSARARARCSSWPPACTARSRARSSWAASTWRRSPPRWCASSWATCRRSPACSAARCETTCCWACRTRAKTPSWRLPGARA
ncbi:hypothetical protein HK415_12005 [Ramlibacter sp. B156]|uniref:ABC transmembrane type-1 domain-containing protein n=1 Tax=Ramlibacter montanisoli TaxID=2732512 RepID=A0A849K889_9BURK|nr:hypothetical protein [Ramlibacter montanisoli]